MTDLLLWRRLTETDFDSMNGEGAKAKTGGGAMHISLGKDGGTEVPMNDFLSSKSRLVTITTEAQPPSVPKATLIFDGNPGRRGGDWRINDQSNHRHPAWNDAHGFPATYDPTNRPLVFVARIDDLYHVRLSDEETMEKISPALSGLIAANHKNTGIVPLDPEWTASLSLPGVAGILGDYAALAEEVEASGTDVFNPKDVKDGRHKILAEVVRRQGQRKFRKALIEAYGACAITGTILKVILEAAHITPYRGKDTNHTSNGILLRGDIHTLFDLGLITIDAASYRIRVSADLVGTEYMAFNNKKIALPKEKGAHPSKAALKEHNKIFQG